MKKTFIALLMLCFSGITFAQDSTSLKRDIIETYAEIVHASYQDSLEATQLLQTAIDNFLAEPTQENFDLAKEAWLASREPYGQTEGYRFYDGPIEEVEGLINAWPLDEAYIDYVEGASDAGIINNTADYPEITAELLESLNEQGSEENIAVGYHAVEFLLWGQDFYEDGPGQRAYTDYTTAPNADRRGQYLKISTDLLVGHLEELVLAWSPDETDNYRATFLALPEDEAISLMVTGIGSLSNSELPGERMYTAYDNQDQEDEHSCFSDNTHRDILMNFLSIRNVYYGVYIRTDGTVIDGAGLNELVADSNGELGADMDALFASIELAIKAMHTPFDRAIVEPEYREQVLVTTDLIFDLGDAFDLVKQALNLS
jgi:putative iron-regulated protein